MAALDDLTAAVAANTTAVNNLIAALAAAPAGDSDSAGVEAQVALLEATTAAATAAVTPAPVAQPPEPPATTTEPVAPPAEPVAATPLADAIDRAGMTTAQAAAAASRGS